VEALIQQLMERPEVTGGGRPTLIKSEALQVGTACARRVGIGFGEKRENQGARCWGEGGWTGGRTSGRGSDTDQGMAGWRRLGV
jgi:hypothetical protein